MNVVDEIIDKYGRLPEEIENLLDVCRIKMLCRENNIIKVAYKNGKIVFTVGKEFDISSISILMSIYKGRLKIDSDKGCILITPTEQNIVDSIKKFFKENKNASNNK